MIAKSQDEWMREVTELRARLEELEETVQAIRSGGVDALLIAGDHGDQVYTLDGTDRSYRVLMETMSEGAATLATDGTILYCNSHFAKLLKTSLQSVIGSSIADYLPSSQETAFWFLIEHGKDAGTRREIVFNCADGSTVPTLVAVNILDAAGTEGISLVATDLTERKAAEDRLRHAHDQLEQRVAERTEDLTRANGALAEKEQRYRLLFDRNPDGVFVLDTTGRFLLANPACETMSGYPLAELTQKTFMELCAPDQLANAIEHFQRALRDQVYTELETVLVHKDGGRIEVWVAGEVTLSADKKVALHCTAKDITQRKHVEQALRQSEEKFRLVSTNSPDTLAIQDRDLRYEWVVNPPLDWIPAETIGKTDRDLLDPEQFERVKALKQQVMNTGEVMHLELPLRKENGELFFYEGAYIPRRNAQETVTGILCYFRDVTGRKQAEEALRKSETKFRSLFDNAMEAVFLTIPDGRITAANPAACAMFGMTEEELIRAGRAGVIAPEETRHGLALEQRSRTGRLHTELNYLRKNGERFPAEVSSVVLEGEPPRSFVILRDITERKRAEEALRESEARFRTVLSDSRDVIYRVTLSTGRFDYVSPSVEKLLGYSPDELMALSADAMTAMNHPDDLAMVKAVIAHLHETGQGEVEHRQRTKSGDYVWISNHLSLVRDAAGRPIYRCGNIRDITERKRAEVALRESEERFRVAQELSPDGFTILRPVRDAQGRVVDFIWVYQNAAIGRLGGTDPQAVVGQSLLELFPGHRGTDIFGAYQHVAENGETRVLEVRYQGESIRTQTWFRLVVVPMEGQIAILAQDITERKRAEELLHSQARHLDHLVQERTTKLRESNEELKHFSYTLVHDMRAPLRAMRGYGEMLLQDMPALGGVGQLYLTRIIAGSDRMDQLITDALDYSLLVRQEFVLEAVDALKLLRGMLTTYPNFQLARGGIAIPNELPMVLANEAGLTQCFANLLNNAIKFVPRGRAPEIRVWAQEKGQRVRFWVEDNGIGIPEDCREKVFGMFQQLDQSYEGTGIGLALVRKAATRMKGEAGVESEPGKGSRFWLELPLANVMSLK